MTIMPENKITQSTLNDFLATVKAEPNISDSDILKSFPEFNNDKTKLDAAWAYKNTLDSKKYKSLDEVNTKFPEFFGQSSTTKPVEEKGLWDSIVDVIGAIPSYFKEKAKPISNTITSQVNEDYKKSTEPVEYKQPTIEDRKKYSQDMVNTFTDIFNQKQISKNFDIHKPTVELQQFKPNELQSFEQTSSILSKLGFVNKPLEDDKGNLLPDSSYQYDATLPKASKQEIEQIKIDLFNSKQDELKRKQFEATNTGKDGTEIASMFTSYSKNKKIENEINQKYDKAFALIDQVEGDINNPFKLPNIFDGVNKQDAQNQQLVNKKASENLQTIKQKKEEFVKTFSIPKDSFNTENKKHPLLNELGDIGYDMLYYNNPVLADNKKTAFKAGVLNEFDSQKAVGTALTKLIQDNNTDLKYNKDLLETTKKRVNEETAKINSGKYIYTPEQKQSIAEANKLAGILQQTIKEQEDWSNFLNGVRDNDTPIYKQSKVEQEKLNELGNKYPILSTLDDLAGNLVDNIKDIPEWFGIAKGAFTKEKDTPEYLLKSMKYSSPDMRDISPLVKSAGQEQLQPLKESSAIQLFNEKGEKEFDYSWRPLLYQSGKMGAEMIPFMVGQFVAQGIKAGIGKAISSQIGKIGAGAAATEIGGYGGLSSIADVTATSIGRNVGSQAVSEAIQKGALQSVGFTTATVLGYAANMIPSTMYFGGEMFQNYINAGFQPSQAAKLALLASAAEGATESIFTNEMDFVRNLTKKGTIKNASELAENQIYKDAIVNVFKTKFTEKQAINLYNYIFKPLAKAGADVVEEGTEEVVSLAFTDFVIDPQARKFKGDYDSGEDFDLENIANTYLSTAATMGLMVGGSVVGGIKNRRAEIKNAQYIVAQSPSKYIENTLNLLEKGHITNDEAQRRINLINKQNQSYKDVFEKGSFLAESKNYTSDEKDQIIFRLFSENYKKQQLSDILLTNPNDKDKAEIVELLNDSNNNIFSLLSDGLYTSDKDRISSRNNYLNSFFTPESINEYVSLPAISSLVSKMKEEQKKESDETLKNTYQLKIELLEERKIAVTSLKEELLKTPEQKAEENNQSGVITLQRPELGSLNIELNVPYHLSSIDSKNEAGNLLKNRPIVTILQDNGDGTVKVAFNNEEVRDVPLEELSKYEFDKEEDVKTLRKERNPKIIAWDNENNVVKYEWDNEAKGVRAKSHTGRLRWNEEKKSVEFVYKNLKGEVVAINIPQKELLKYAKNEKGGKLSFVKSLIQNADQKKEEEKSKESVAKSDLSKLQSQSLRRWEFIKRYITEKQEELKATKVLISNVEDQLLDTEIELEKLQDQLSKKENLNTKKGTKRVDVQKLFDKLNTLQNLHRELSSLLDEYEQQKQDLQNEIEYVSQYKGKDFEEDTSIVDQLIDDQFKLETQLEQVNGVISDLRNLVSGIEDTIKKITNTISNLVKGFQNKYGEERTTSYNPDEIRELLEIDKLLSKEYPDYTTFLSKNPEYLKNLAKFNELVNNNLDKLDLSEKDVENLKQSIKANIDVAKRIQDKIRYQESLIAKAQDSQKQFGESKQNKKKQELLSKIFLTPSGNVVDTEDNEQLTEYDPKVDLLLSGSATTTGGTESNPLPNQSVIDLQEFLNSVGNIRNYRLLAITKDNAKNFGLESIVYTDENFTNKTDEESDNDIVLALVLNNNSDTPTFVDKQGNLLESPTKESIVYTKMRTSSLTFGSKNTKAGEKNYSTTLSEEQEAKIAPKISDLRKTLRQNTINHIKGGNNAYFEIKGISRGHVQDQSDSPKSVVGNLIPSDVDLSVEQVIQIPKQTDNKNAQGEVQFAGDGTIRQFPKGRPVLNFRQHLSFLHTKKFAEKDLTKLLNIFKYLYDNIENKQEVDVILDYLKKTLYFRDPSKISPITDKSQQSAIAKQQIWISRDGNGNNFIHFGNQDFKIPFSFENVDNILALQTFLTQIPGGLYHNVDFQDTKDGNVMMKPFTEITGIDKQGNLVARQWATYQQYLLSDKYPDGQLRPVDEIPLYTKVNPSTPNNPNIAGRYIVFGNEGGNYETALKDIKTQEVKAVIPQVPSVQGDVNLVSKPNIKSFNDIKEPGEYILQSVTDKNVMYSITWDGKKVTVDDVKGVNAETSAIETALTNAVLGKTKSNTVFITWKNEPKEQPKPNNLPTPEVKSTTPEEKTELANTNQAVPDFPTESLSEDEILRILTQGTEEAQSTDTEYRKVTRNSQYKLIDIEKSKAWWQERFPQIPFQYVTGFINNKAFGALYKGAVTISRAAEVGTEFHEAFEVYWKHFSTPAQMRRSIREFKNRKGTFVDYETGETIEFSKATYHQIKEQLAEEYREYELSNGKIKWEGEFNKNSLFRRIFNAIHDFFLNTQTTEEVFKAISDGKFKTAKPKNLNLNNLNAENRISQLKKNSVFFNDAMKSITFYLFDSLNKDEKSIVDIFNEVGKVNQNLDKQYDVVKQKLEIFYSANNLPTFLSLTKEQFIKAFSNRAFYDSYTKISPDLKNALNQVVVQQKLTDIEMAEKLYDVFVSANVLLKNWDEAVQLNKNYLSKYGVEFIESEEEINEDDKTSEYTPEITKYNKKQNTNAEIKALIATLTSKYYQKVFTSEFSTNQVTPKVNSILQPELVDFGATFVKLLYKLAPTSTFEEMSEMLIKESKENDPSLINLVNRLQLENKGELSSYVVELRNKFYQAMNSMVVDYDNLMINTNLTGNPINVNDVKHKNKIKFKWVNNLKSSSFVVYGEDGSMQFSSTSFTKPSDLTTAIEFLKEIGFNTTFKKGELSPKEIQVVLANSSKIYEVIKSTQAAQIFWQNAAILNKQIDELADIEQKYSNDYFESQHINIEGEPVSNILLNNFLGYVTKAFNYAPTLDKFYEAVPQLNPKNLNNAFQKNSLILDKNTRFFDENGKEKSKISISILEGVKDRESEKYTHTSEMSESDMFAQEFSYNLDGKYSILTPADSRTPWGWNIGTFVSKEEAKNNKKYLEIFKKYLIAEIETARQENVYSLAELSKKRNKLRFFDGIINIDVNNNISPEQLVKQNEAKIEEEFSKLLEENVKKTIEYLTNNNLIKDFKPESGTFATVVGEKPSRMVVYTSTSNQPTGLSDEQLEDLVRFREINYMINIIEQHKVLWGDPAQWKAATKRIKSYLSGRRLSINNAKYFDDYNNKFSNQRSFVNKDGEIETFQLEPTDKGFHFFSDIIKTQTFQDVLAIPADNILNSIKESLAKLQDSEVNKYEEGVEADAQALIFLPGYREIRKRDTTWSNKEEEVFLWDEANMFQDLLNRSANPIDFYPKGKKGEKLKEAHRQILKKGNPFLSRLRNDEDLPVINVLKPIYSGFKNVDAAIQNIDKMSGAPLTWSLVKGTNLEPFYIAHYVKGTHYVRLESANKIGKRADIEPLYVNGRANTNVKQEELNFKYFGIQVETIAQKETSTLGTQMTKLITSGLMKFGVPIDTKYTRDEWNKLTEEEKENSSKLYRLVKRNHSILSNMKALAKKDLFNKFGISETTIDGKKVYEFKNLLKLNDLIQREFKQRDVAENIKELIKVVVKDGKEKFVAPLDAIIGAEKLEAMFTSIIDKSILRPKMRGGQLPQVSSTLFEKNNRKAVYKKGEKWVNVTNFEILTKEEKDSVRLVSENLKFYEDVDGKRYCEVILPYSFKDMLKEGDILSIDDIPDELKYGVGFRIPTQGHNSIENFKIKGFLPIEYGDAIIVPSEITTKAGSDFDIDKLNIYLYNYVVDKNGIPQKIKFLDGSNSTPEERYREYVKSKTFDILDEIKDEDSFNEIKETYFKPIYDKINKVISTQVDKSAQSKATQQAFQDFKQSVDKLKNEKLRRNIISIVSEKEDSIYERQETLDSYLKDNAFKEISSLSKEDKKVVSTLLLQYGEYISLYNKTKDFRNILKDVIKETKGYEEFKKEFKEAIKNSFADFIITNELGNPSFEEFSKLPIEQQNSKKALENAYLDNTREILQLPEVFPQLVNPNTVKPLEDIAKKVRELNKISDRTTAPLSNYLSSLNNTATRYMFLVGKRGVGIAAKNNTSHAIFMELGIEFNPNELIQNHDSLRKKGIIFNISMPYNEKNGRVVMSNDTDAEGVYKISDVISMFLNAFVDIANNPFISDVNGNLTTAGVYLTGVRMGIPISYLGRFMSQPIIKDYIRLKQNNKSISTIVSGGTLFPSEMINILQDKYGFQSLINERENNYSLKELEDFITNPDSAEFGQEQGYILGQYLILDALSKDLFIFDQAFPDTTRTVSFESIRIKLFNINKVKETVFKNYLPSLLKNTFLGATIKPKYEILQALRGKNDEESLYVSEKSVVRKYLDPILFDIYSKFISMDEKETLAKDMKRQLISYFIQTIPVSFNNELPQPLTSQIERLLLNPQDRKTIASRLRNVQFALQEGKLDIPNQTFIPNLLSVFPTLSKKLTTTVNLLRKPTDKIDADQLTNDFSALFDYGQTRAFAEDLVKTALLKSGVTYSPNSFTEIIPSEIFENIISQIEEKINNSAYTEQLLNNFWNSYVQNNYYNEGLAFPTKARNSSDKTRIRSNVLSFIDPATKQKRFVPVIQYNVIKNYGEDVYLPKDVRSKYLLTTVEQYKIEPQAGFEDGEYYSKKEKEEMKKKGDYSFLKRTLWLRVDALNPNTGKVEPVMGEMYNEKYNTNWDYVMYIPIPLMGDRSNLLEHYPTMRGSKVNDFMSQTPQMRDEYLSKLRTPETFYQYLTTELSSSFKGKFFYEELKRLQGLDTQREKILFDEEFFEDMENIATFTEMVDFEDSQDIIETLIGNTETPTQEVIEQPIQNKEGIDFVFEQSPELISIGTQEQYAQYLDTIFPDSKVKDIVYHVNKTGIISPEDGRKFYSTSFGSWLEELEEMKGNRIPIILNITNPTTVDSYYEFSDQAKKFRESGLGDEFITPDEVREPGTDSVIGRDSGQGGNEKTYVTYSSNQVYQLGSKQDVEGFKKFVAPKQGVQELFESNPELANQVYEALGFDKSTFDTKGITLSKETSIGWMFIQLNNKKIGRVKFVNNGEKGQLGLSIEINEEYQNKGYGQIVHILMADLAKKDYKSNLYSDYQNSSQEIQLLNSLVKKGYAEKIGDVGKASKEYPDSFVTEERAFRIKTSDEIRTVTPQQKQQAQELYSQYLESLNKPNTNPVLQGNQKPDVILPIGTSGSGKSTFIKSLPQENLVVIEPDSMRVEFTGDINDKSKDKEIYIEAANRAIQAIKQGKQVVFDTTNLTKDKRFPFIEAIKKAIPTANIQYKLMELNPELAKQRIKDDIERINNFEPALKENPVNINAKFPKDQVKANYADGIIGYGTHSTGKYVSAFGGTRTSFNKGETIMISVNGNNRTNQAENVEKTKRAIDKAINSGVVAFIADNENVANSLHNSGGEGEIRNYLLAKGLKYKLFKGVGLYVVNRANVPDSTIDRHAESYKQMLEDIKSEGINNYDVNQPTEIKPNEVIPLTTNFSRESIKNDSDYIYLFTDNAKRTSGKNSIEASSWYRQKYTSNYPLSYPSMTQAVARGLNNAFPITTMVDDNRTQWKDSQFEEYKKIIDDEINNIKEAQAKFKGIKFAAQMPFGQGKISNMKQSAPKIWNYLNEKLAEIGIDNTGTTPKVVNQPTEIKPKIDSSKKINIYAGTNENAELSNFALRPFEADLGGINKLGKFKSVEAAFQYAKSSYADPNTNNENIREKLKNAIGADAKSLGRKITDLNNEEWDDNSSEVMKTLLKQSFEQNPKALETLLATGNATLTHTQDKGKWGKEFPRLLMEVRQELTQEQPIVEETLQLKDGKNYNKSEINTKLLESLGYTPSEIGKILKEIC